MSVHDEHHEDLLELFLTEGVRDVGARRELLECDHCRPLLEGLEELRGGLDRAGSNEREDVERARREAGAEDEELMLSTWRDRIRPPRRSWGRSSLLFGALAAGIAGVLWIAPWRSSPPEEQAPILLGPGEIKTLGPSGTGADYSHFTWKCEAVPGWRYHVEVWSDDDNPRLLHRSSLQEAMEWKPLEEEHTSWTESIQWCLFVTEAGEPRSSSEWVSASR